MYLDKPLRRHTLFQAMTRTNRRCTHPATGQEKRYGLVVDYVGLGNEIAKALRAADPERGGKRPVDVEDLVEEFAAAMANTLDRFEASTAPTPRFDALSAAQERLPPGDSREAFARDFMTVQGLWEFLHPSPVSGRAPTRLQVARAGLRVGQADRACLTRCCGQRLGAKTLALVHGHMTDLKVTGTGLDEVVVDDETIEAIRQLALPGTDVRVKDKLTVGEALDTIEARIRRRLEESDGHAVYVSLAERLEQLRRRHMDQAASSVEFLQEMLAVARRCHGRGAGRGRRAARRGLAASGPEHRGPDPDLPGVRARRHPGHHRGGRRQHRRDRPPGPFHRLDPEPARRPRGPPTAETGTEALRSAAHRRTFRPRIRLHSRELLRYRLAQRQQGQLNFYLAVLRYWSRPFRTTREPAMTIHVSAPRKRMPRDNHARAPLELVCD